MRKPKALWTEQVGGELITRYHAEDEHDEGPGWRRRSPASHDPAGRRAPICVGRRRRLLPDQRPEPGRRGGAGPAQHPLQGRRRHQVLRPPGGQGPARLPPGRGQPGRRGLAQAGRQRPQARGRRHQRGPARRLGRSPRGSPSARPWTGPRRPASPAGRSAASASCSTLLADLRAIAPDRPVAEGGGARRSRRGGRGRRPRPGGWYGESARRPCSRRCSTGRATGRSSRPSGRSSRPAGWRTWPSWSARPREVDDIDGFLEQVSLVADSDELDGDDSKVVLMTLHTAKGLEFPRGVPGRDGGRRLPHLRSLGEPDELEEERRLCYVGITRAKERLYLTYAWCRSPVGPDAVQPAQPFPQGDPRRPCSGWPRAVTARSGRDSESGSGFRGRTASSRRPSDGRDGAAPVRGDRCSGPGPAGRRRCRPCQVGRRRGPRRERARATGPRRWSASRVSARSDCCCPWPR